MGLRWSTQSNFTKIAFIFYYSSSYIYFCHNLPPLEAQTSFPLSCHFSTVYHPFLKWCINSTRNCFSLHIEIKYWHQVHFICMFFCLSFVSLICRSQNRSSENREAFFPFLNFCIIFMFYQF